MCFEIMLDAGSEKPIKKEKCMCKERFINPFTDFGFKKLFGSEENKRSLISILNAIIADGDDITDLSYLPTEKLGMGQRSRVAVFDLYCKTQNGSHIIVEMQNNSQDFFVDRSIYYSSFPIQEAAKKGKWDYQLPKIFTVSFLNFEIHQLEGSPSYRSVVKLADEATGKVFYDRLSYIYIELPKFCKKKEELETELDWWLYILKYLDQFDEIPKEIEDDVMRYFFNSADVKHFTRAQIQAYEDSLKALRDYQNILDSAVRKSLKDGRAEGLAEGRAEGRAEGLAEGREEERRKIVARLKELGLSVSEIAKATGISEREING